MQQMWQIRHMIALVMLGICAYTDIKEKNIYIVPLVISATGGCLITLTAFFGIADYTKTEMLIELIAPAVAGVVIIVITCIKNIHIGSGDGYLMAALGMIIGIRNNMYVLAFSSIVLCIYAAIRVLIKRKRIIRTVPFAPFVMTGFMIVMVNEI